MLASTRRILSMLRRALDFVSSNQIDDPDFKTLLDQFGAGVTAITALAQDETVGRDDQRAATAQRRYVRHQIRQYLVRVVNLGMVAAATHPELVETFQLPRPGQPSKVFLLSARALSAAAGDHADLLQPLGLGSTFVADLNAALDLFEKLGTAIDAGRGKHTAASQSFQRTVTTCRRCIAALDSWYRMHYAPGDPVLQGWLSARRTEGPFKRHSAANGGDTPAPAPSTPPASAEGKVA